jgi:hypothetical protein
MNGMGLYPFEYTHCVDVAVGSSGEINCCIEEIDGENEDSDKTETRSLFLGMICFDNTKKRERK